MCPLPLSQLGVFFLLTPTLGEREPMSKAGANPNGL
jgi:hypothetical protein